MSFLKEIRNWKIEKHNESQSVKYPKEGAMIKIIMLSTFRRNKQLYFLKKGYK